VNRCHRREANLSGTNLEGALLADPIVLDEQLAKAKGPGVGNSDSRQGSIG